MFFGLRNNPKGTLIRDWIIILKAAAFMPVGMRSKKLLVAKTTVSSTIVRTPIPMAPKSGVHLKKLPDMKEEK
jgi:hypothetical protein